jgi:hypothetical protein
MTDEAFEQALAKWRGERPIRITNEARDAFVANARPDESKAAYIHREHMEKIFAPGVSIERIEPVVDGVRPYYRFTDGTWAHLMPVDIAAQIFGPGFNPFAGPPTAAQEDAKRLFEGQPAMRELSLEEAVTALVETAHHQSKQGQIDALGRRGIVLAKR